MTLMTFDKQSNGQMSTTVTVRNSGQSGAEVDDNDNENDSSFIKI